MGELAADVRIRPATKDDVPALGRLGASLMRLHYAFDAQRFLAPGGNPEEGYGRFLGHQLREPDATVFVAERAGEVAGYVYAGIEPLSWKELRDEAGFIHDIVVDESHRGGGIATALIETASLWLKAKGVPRVILWTAESNHAAKRLFEQTGFRRTMIEMTREL
ncbi:MAG TPA: GNAT family N-acetyltransferase [Vicinamibacterales bacterium]|nr:GNAT family N-acetyltransferase [Vicinamibacterales bacterium]